MGMGSGITHAMVDANGISMHVAEAGEGPAVLCCHGFPESWYSWRHQLGALAEAGFRVIAPDMRGYGRTDRPADPAQYSLLHLVGDMVGLLDALNENQAVIVGHDWGAPVAWHAALMRPDRFRGVVGLSVPFRPRSKNRPTAAMPQDENSRFYQLYFQETGIADRELARDVRRTIRSLLHAASGDALEGGIARSPIGMVPRDGGFLTEMADPERLPAWLNEHDIDIYVQDFERTGFTGGLNWYRNIDRNWELLAPFADAKISVPALYVVGEVDLVLGFKGMPRLLASLSSHVPQLQATIRLPHCGHWTQQERPDAVNLAIIDFLSRLT